MNKKFSKYKNFSSKVADMEHLPFDDHTFDVICMAGSLSYGDNQIVMNEIYTYLKGNNYDMCLYWIFWVFEWEKRNLKANNSWHIDSRVVDVQPKFQSDLVWIIWELIHLQCENVSMEKRRHIKALYILYLEGHERCLVFLDFVN